MRDRQHRYAPRRQHQPAVLTRVEQPVPDGRRQSAKPRDNTWCGDSVVLSDGDSRIVDMAMDDDVDPDDELEGAIGPFPCADWSLEQCASALDAAAAEQTVFKMFNRVRTTFGVPQYLISTTVVPGTSVATAALQAWDYHATIGQRPIRRIVLEPRNCIVDHHEPVLVRDASPEIIAHWHALLAVARAPVVRARLLHPLWQRGSTNGRDLAVQAADNY